MNDLMTALCLMLIIEAIGPVIMPQAWKEFLHRITQLDNRQIRIAGLVAMFIGLGLLQFYR